MKGSRQPVKQTGLSLVELMIALSLGLVLLLGVYQIFDLQQRGFSLVVDVNEREDNAQLALKILSDAIRMADHWGGVSADEVKQLSQSLSAKPGACDESWVFDSRRAIFGLQGQKMVSSIQGLPSQCLKATDYQAESDLLAIRYADSHQLFTDAQVSSKRYQQHYFVRSEAGHKAVLFQGKDYAAAQDYIEDHGYHYTMAFHSSLFFIKPCSKQMLGCSHHDHVLMRLHLQGDRYVQQALVEGIEQMHFEYGIDATEDGRVDKYLTADKVVKWSSVRSIRLFLLVRSAVKDNLLDEQGKVYLMSSAASASKDQYVVDQAGRYYRRKVYQQEIAIRNRHMN